MRNYLSITYCFLLLFACHKDTSISEVLTDFKISPTTIPADGLSTVALRVTLTDKSNSDRRNVVFSTSMGVFTESGNNKCLAKAKFENGVLIAKATLKPTTWPGTIKVSVEPEFDSPIKEFILKDSIIAQPSIPNTIMLEPDSFGISSNFSNLVKINGVLKNSQGKSVSQGYNVLFEDFLFPSSNSANGRFKNLQTSTAEDSKVSCSYSANQHSLGTIIEIRCTLLNNDGTKTDKSHSVLLNINK